MQVNNEEGINALSLFNGMGCIWIALDRAEIKVNKRYSSEIDKYANIVNDANYPDTIQLGDITKVFAKDLPKIDLIAGGSPCQGFSFAGKGLNFEDSRSKLFFEYVRIYNEVKEINPNVLFLLENVQMKYEHELVISRYLNVNPIVINSSLVSAQNRVRNYWTNINNKPYGLFGEMKPDITLPKDKGIRLKDILEKYVSDKYTITSKGIQKILRRNWSAAQIEPDKNGCILPKNNSDQLSVDSGTTLINVDAKLDSNKDLIITHNMMPRSSNNKKGGSGHLSKSDGKSYCLDTGNTNAIELKCVAMRGRNIIDGKRKDYIGASTEQRLEVNSTGKTNCLTNVQKDNLVMQINPSIESNGCQPYQQNRGYDTEGRSPALMAQISSGTHAILDKSPCLHGFEHGTNGQLNKQLVNGGLIRRLTEVECERLQTVPDNYTNHVSSTQRYKMLGNGWTVDVISHILKKSSL